MDYFYEIPHTSLCNSTSETSQCVICQNSEYGFQSKKGRAFAETEGTGNMRSEVTERCMSPL